MPYLISMFWGVLTAVIFGLCTPLMVLGEMGGPINFAIPFLVILVLMLAIAAYTSHAKGGIRGSAYGVLFAIPVVLACLIIPHTDDFVRREHGGQLLAVAVSPLFISLAVMAAVGHWRSLPKKR